MDASQLTLLRRDRNIYYNAIINQAAIDLGLKLGSPAITYSDSVGARLGSLRLTLLEQQDAIKSVSYDSIGKLYIWTIYDGRTTNPSNITENSQTSRSIEIDFYNYGDKDAITELYVSLDGGPYQLSPIPIVSYVYYINTIISNLTPGKTYTINILGKNAGGFGIASDPFTVTMPLITIVSFTDPQTYEWTAPKGVTQIQLLMTGGGGGGGGCCSSVINLGTVPWAAANPGGASTYWISSVNGRIYKGSSIYNPGFNPIQLSISGVPSSPTMIFVNTSGYILAATFLNQVGYTKNNCWITYQCTYTVINGIPYTINTIRGNATDSDAVYKLSQLNNKASAGSGGGSQGQILNNVRLVNELSTYTIIVGAAGLGGAASPGFENDGTAGGDSYFGTERCIGGSGGASSMNPNLVSQNYSYGGWGGFAYNNTISQVSSAVAYIRNYTSYYNDNYFRSTCSVYNRTFIAQQYNTARFTTSTIRLPTPSPLTVNNITDVQINDGCCGVPFGLLGNSYPSGLLYYNGPNNGNNFNIGRPRLNDYCLSNYLYDTKKNPNTYYNVGSVPIDLLNNGNIKMYGMPGLGGFCGVDVSTGFSARDVRGSSIYGVLSTTTTVLNTGSGGFGTGAPAGGYASGMDGSAGVVIITYS